MATARDELDTPPDVAIRAMLDGDVAAVAALEKRSYQFPWSAGIFRDCVRIGYVCRVVEIDRALVGYGILSVGAGEAHILNICVAEEQRTRGIGRMLLRHLLDRAIASGVSDAFLEVRPSNMAAIRLYQSLGFMQIGTRRGYYQAVGGREDATVFKLDLRELGGEG